jgi:hypothetical protein
MLIILEGKMIKSVIVCLHPHIVYFFLGVNVLLITIRPHVGLDIPLKLQFL